MTALKKPLGEQRSVPLASLELSLRNVRGNASAQGASGGGADGDDPTLPRLQASIAAQGIITPLAVEPVARKKDRFAVVAGGRRWRALRNLANANEIGENYAVPVVVFPAGAPLTEISLAENLERAALKPHEEYAGFAKLSDEGLQADEIALHFGVTVRRVGQLLRLGNLAVPVREAFAAGQIDESEAQAYAATSDIELQAKVYAALSKKHKWERGQYEIRRAIKGVGSELIGKLRAVGIDAFTEAGGRFDADLFGRDEYEGRVVDPDILDTLFAAKEAEALAALKATMPEVELVDGVEWSSGQKVDVERGELEGVLAIEAQRLTGEIGAKRADLDALTDDDGALIDADDEPHAERLNDEIEALQDKLDVLSEQAPMVLPAPADGCKFVASPQFVPTEGRWTSTAVMMVPEEWTPENPVELARTPASSGASRPAPAPTGGFGFMKAEYGLSEASVEVMKGHRLMILQAAMMNDGGSGADLLTFVTVRAIDGGISALGMGLAYFPEEDSFASNWPEISGQPGARAIDGRLEEMERSWLLEPDTAKAWPMFLDLEEMERQEWAAYAGTLILARSLNAPGLSCGLHDAIPSELTVPLHIRDHWTPDAAFWARVPKKHRLAALRSIDEELEAQSKKLDNEMLTERCVGVFSGDQAMIAKIIPEGRAAQAAIAAAKWVPEYLQFRARENAGRTAPAPIDVSNLGLGAGAEPIAEAAE